MQDNPYGATFYSEQSAPTELKIRASALPHLC